MNANAGWICTGTVPLHPGKRIEYVKQDMREKGVNAVTEKWDQAAFSADLK